MNTNTVKITMKSPLQALPVKRDRLIGGDVGQVGQSLEKCNCPHLCAGYCLLGHCIGACI